MRPYFIFYPLLVGRTMNAGQNVSVAYKRIWYLVNQLVDCCVVSLLAAFEQVDSLEVIVHTPRARDNNRLDPRCQAENTIIIVWSKLTADNGVAITAAPAIGTTGRACSATPDNLALDGVRVVVRRECTAVIFV